MATTLGRAALNAEATKQAAVVAYANDFKLMMIVALVALPLIFLLKRAKAQPGEQRSWSRDVPASRTHSVSSAMLEHG